MSKNAGTTSVSGDLPLAEIVVRPNYFLAALAVLLSVGLVGCATTGADKDRASAPKSLPLVYANENTGAKYPAPPLPSKEQAAFIEPLPDPFAWANDPLGKTRSTSSADWEHHRAEMAAEIEHYEIGTKPPRPDNMVASYTNGMLTVKVTVGTNALTLHSRVIVPPGDGPFPAIIGMNSPNGSVNRALLTNVVKITFSHNQVTVYNRPRSTDPYFKLYPELWGNSGQYSAWAWGVSRIIDGLEMVQSQLPVDLKHVGVTGCSYAGKMALFSGALDERVALTIAQESGGGGDTSWRYSATEKTGSVEGLAQTSHQWFRQSMFQFGGTNVSYLPEDHHMLCALVAPRALFCTGNTNYVWLSNPSAYVCCRAAEKVYDNFGIGDRFGFNIIGGHPHCATTRSIDAEMGAFVNKFLLGQADVDTRIRDFHPEYSTIDYARWSAWWGTGKPTFPK